MNPRHGIFSIFAFSFVIPILIQCSSNSPGTGGDQAIAAIDWNGLGFNYVERGDLTFDGNQLTGSGSIVFADTLEKADSNYVLEFTLASEGSVELVANAFAGLKQGAGMKLSRDAKDFVVMEVNTGSKTIDITEKYEALVGSGPFDASAPIHAAIDVHGHGDVVLWLNNGKALETKADRVNGQTWGIKLNKATLTGVSRGKPEFKH